MFLFVCFPLIWKKCTLLANQWQHEFVFVIKTRSVFFVIESNEKNDGDDNDKDDNYDNDDDLTV